MPRCAQVGLDERPADRLRHGEEPPRRFRRSGGDGRANGLWAAARFGARQTQKAPRLLGDVAKVDETAALADHVEQIAMFGRGGIGPMPGGAGTGLRSAEPDEHRPAGRVANVAHRPVAALAPPVGQVMAADRLGIAGEAARQFGSVAGHHANSPRRADIMLRRSRRSSVGPRPIAGAQHNPRRNIFGPFAGGAGTVVGSVQADIEAAARRVLDVADDPVAARTASVGEVMAAHGLGIAREAARQLGACDDMAASSHGRPVGDADQGKRSINAPRMAGWLIRSVRTA